MNRQPSVSILLPVLNESLHIRECLASIFAQDYPSIVEILVAEGGSTDGTRETLQELEILDPRLRVIENPNRIQSRGLNMLISSAIGEALVRVDAHTIYAPDYVSRSVGALLDHRASMVGGPMVAVGTTPTEKAVAIAMRSPWAAGPSVFRNLSKAGEADTVYLGTFRADTVRSLGGYRTFTSGVAEDADLAFRIRQKGGRIVQDPSIQSHYRPRSTFPSLWRQFYKYGRGKTEMIFANRALPSARPLAPLALVISLLTAFLMGIVGSWWVPFLSILGLWTVTILALSARHGRLAHRVALAACTMHLSYGFGFARGLLSRQHPVRPE